MDKILFLHIGLPKTATTTLQNHVFCNHSSFLYLGKHHSGYIPDALKRDQWIQSFIFSLIEKDRPYFSTFSSIFFDTLRERFQEELFTHDKWLLSEEGILSRCLRPAKYRNNIIQIGSAYDIIDKLALMNRCSAVFEIRLLITLRRQDNLVHSYFAQAYEKYRSYFGLDMMNQYVDYLLDLGKGGPTDSVLNFASLIAHADTLFGEDNVLVLPYELMSDRPCKYLTNISNFMGIDNWDDHLSITNNFDNQRSLSNGAKSITMNRLNAIIKIKRYLFGNTSWNIGYRLNKYKFLRKIKHLEFSDEGRKRVMNRYASLNRKLIDRVPYLEKYGYFN